MFYQISKRIFDIILSIIGLVACVPIMAGISIVILVSMGWPILFVQDRPGLNGKTFKIYKFRTMAPIRAENPAATDQSRLSSVGLFLRASSLDELPELLNVLKGEMSLVGPRPLLVDYLDNYNGLQLRRHDVRPGITGLAQVRGRNTLSWRNKFRYDVFYVQNASFLFDLKILAETFWVVLARRGFKDVGEGQRFEGRKSS